MSTLTNPKEKLVRFVFQDSQITVSTRKIHWRAFEPRYSNASKKIEVSVFRIDSLDAEKITDLGFRHVAPLQGREPKFKIEFEVSHPQAVQLKVEEETTSHPLHANILDWPSDESAILEKAKELTLVLKNDHNVLLAALTPPALS